MEFVTGPDERLSPGEDLEAVNEDLDNLPPLKYDALPESTSFRVLKTLAILSTPMRFSLTTASLQSPPSYSALSYTWGSADPNDNLTADYTKTIIVNGCVIAITENLWGALKTIHSGQGYLWVDALCINQQDLVERSAQVQMMGAIYSKAWQVVVWLGRGDRPSSAAFEIIQDFVPRLNQFGKDTTKLADDPSFWEKIGREPFTNLEANALTHFFDRYWFDRVWIIQEAFLAKEITVLCGLDKFEWKDLVAMSLFMHSSGLAQRWQEIRSVALKDRFVRAVGIAPMVINNLRKGWEGGIPIEESESLPALSKLAPDLVEHAFIHSLWYLIRATRLYQCTMPHDKVFAPAALALHQFLGKLEPGFLPLDYTKSVEEAYTTISRLIVTKRADLDLLYWVEDISFRKHKDLPSWVPDFSVVACSPLLALEGTPQFNCMRGCEIPCQVLCYGRGLLTKGFRLDIVTVLGPAHTIEEPVTYPPTLTSRSTSTFKILPTPWLQFLLALDKQYFTRESSTSAFIRTIKADQKRRLSETQLLTMFHSYLLYTLAGSRDMEDMLEEASAKFGDITPKNILPLFTEHLE